jgi:DNA-binding NarL/FixJ family response regulator
LRVLVVARAEGARFALRARLEAGGVVVCAETTDGALAVAAVRRERPDLCLVDDSPPLCAAPIVAAIAACAPEVRSVVLGNDPSDEELLAAVAAGACGYLAHRPSSPRLLAALTDVAAGRPAFPRRLAGLLIASVASAPEAF